jgi:hypothetical protein
MTGTELLLENAHFDISELHNKLKEKEAEIDQLYQQVTIANSTTKDLAILIRRLVRYIPNDINVKTQAIDYLQRKKLTGSPMRKD